MHRVGLLGPTSHAFTIMVLVSQSDRETGPHDLSRHQGRDRGTQYLLWPGSRWQLQWSPEPSSRSKLPVLLPVVVAMALAPRPRETQGL